MSIASYLSRERWEVKLKDEVERCTADLGVVKKREKGEAALLRYRSLAEYDLVLRAHCRLVSAGARTGLESAGPKPGGSVETLTLPREREEH